MSEEKKFLDGVGLKHYHDTQVKTHIDNKSNPHGITVEQIGAQPKGDYVTSADISAQNFITVDDIDTICGASIQMASEVTF